MQALVIQKVPYSTYPVDKSLSSGKCDWFPNTSPLGSDLSCMDSSTQRLNNWGQSYIHGGEVSKL